MRQPFTAIRLIAAILLWSGSLANADQNAPALDGLFDRLAKAESFESASLIEAGIWQAWLEPPSPQAGRLTLQIDNAMRMRRTEQALAVCDVLVTRYPDFAEGWNKRATLRYLSGDFDGSVADIERTLELEPRHFGALSGLGLIFLGQGDLVGATSAFEAVLALSPASRSAQANLERVRTEMKNRDI